MRILVGMILAIGTIAAATPLQAQTYDPNYPVCMQVYSKGANYITCGYTSIGQCQASASGRGAQCLTNPYYAGPYQRKRRAY
jgi:hypothetical protein